MLHMLHKSRFNFQNFKALGLRQGPQGIGGRLIQRVGTGNALLYRGPCGALAPEGID